MGSNTRLRFKKKQYFLQVSLSLNACTKVKIAIVFRGSSKRKTGHEKPAYYKEMSHPAYVVATSHLGLI